MKTATTVAIVSTEKDYIYSTFLTDLAGARLPGLPLAELAVDIAAKEPPKVSGNVVRISSWHPHVSFSQLD